jgi:putative N6-adenine-specific DNA methylase
MEQITLIATATFGLETAVKHEVTSLGYDITHVSNGRIEFSAIPADIPHANLWLRCADRVLLKMGEFTAVTFDDLFEQTKAIPWETLITADGQFTVNARASKSVLLSDRSVQSIVKKAVVERLQAAYNVDWFPETGAAFTIEVTIFQDVALLAVDTSGDGLHKRGYRQEAGEAPLKETMAAGLVALSFWNRERLLIDPFCGAGTILIEVALMGRNMAPGLQRSFAAEAWPLVPTAAWAEARAAALAAQNPEGDLQLFGYDIDRASIEIARRNAERAGVAGDITFEPKDVHDLWIDQQYGILIANPPYGQRVGDFRELNRIYITLNKMFRKKTGWSIYILTADKKFPHYFKRAKPDRVRKMYNGRIEVNYYQYYGEKPPV